VVVELKYQYYFFSITSMLHQKIIKVKIEFWRRISQSEIRNLAAAESEGGQKFLPPNPLSFCPPERSVWRAERAVSSVQNRFGFRQTNAPNRILQIFGNGQRGLLAAPAGAASKK